MVKIIAVLSGIGDRNCKVLNGATPLEVARTKNLDYFASKSNGGYLYPTNEKIAPKSDEAFLSILGYDINRYTYSRGPLEAYGTGLDFKEGYLALRTNFATLEGGKLIDRRVGRSLTTQETREFARAINEQVRLDVPFFFHPTIGHRGVLIFRGDFSDNVTNVDPAYRKVGRFGVALPLENHQINESRPLDPSKESKLSARFINEFVKQSNVVLSAHELNFKRKKNYLLSANILITRDAGNSLPLFPKREGFGALTSLPLEIGICKLAGMRVFKFEYPEMKNHDVYAHLFHGLETSIKESIKFIKQAQFQKYFIHFKETDLPGHDNKPKEKKEMIELLDKKFFAFLRDEVKDLELVVTGDHATPCELKAHSLDPVPFLHYGKEKRDSVLRFTEHECKQGSYGGLFGKDLLKKVGFL